jgi:membrane protease YdiL (CAAX protease family)
MDQMLACPDCGTPNRSDADLCVQCWRGMDEDVAARIPVAAFAVATATPPRTLRPAPPAPPAVSAPASPVAERPVGEAAPGPVPYFAPLPQPVPGGIVPNTVPAPVATERRRGNVKWRWRHLWAVGVCAWGLPEVLAAYWAPRFQGRGILDAALAIQIVGYVLAALVVAVLVSRVNNGDWGSVGIRWSENAYDDMFRGAGFGLVLIGTFLLVTFAISGGELEVDGLVKMLIGGTSGPGFFLAAAVLVVGAPVIEEIYYRGMLYEKFGRWGRWPAIVGTSILFVAAHGALIIPALMLLAFGVAWKRQTKTLWYTMGAHAAWNLVVLCLGVFLMSGPAEAFTPPDGSYTLRHAADWEPVREGVVSGPTGSVDLVLMTPSGSFIVVGRTETHPGIHRGNLKSALLSQVEEVAPLPYGATLEGIEESDLMGGLAKAYEMSLSFSDPVAGDVDARVVVAVRDPEQPAFLFVVACPEAECPTAGADFESLVRSFQFAR